MKAASQTPAVDGLDEAYLPFLKELASAVPAAGVAEMRDAASRLRLPWQAGGPAMAETVEETIDTPQGPTRLRVYRPVAGRRSPTLVYFHGGGWTLLGLDTHDRIMREYAAASHWVVIGVEQPLAPEVRFPDTVAACLAAVRAIAGRDRSAAALPLAIAGDSSGANLALAAALAARDQGCLEARALILNYGVYDARTDRPSYDAFSDPPFTLGRDRMTWFWDQYCPDETARGHPLAAPLHADLRGLPPVRLVTAGLDVLRDENLALLVRLCEAGNAVSLDHHPRAPHGFLEALAVHDEARQAIARSAAWLAATAGR